MAKATTIYLNHRDGATHQLSGKRLGLIDREHLTAPITLTRAGRKAIGSAS